MIYTVVAGDTITSIAQRYGLTVPQLIQLNRLTSAQLSIGQRLLVSAAGSGTPSPAPAPAPARPTPAPAPAPSPAAPPAGGQNLPNFIAMGLNPAQADQLTRIAANRRVYRTAQNANQYTIYLPDGSASTFRIGGMANAAYAEGVAYSGRSVFNIANDVLAKYGLTSMYGDILRFLSKNEGCFDAINTWDTAHFSYGFIQFAHLREGGSFTRLLALMKQRQPQAFAQYFQACGIDVDTSVKQPALVIANPFATDGKFFTKGLDAAMALKADKALYAPFIVAGFFQPFMEAQIEAAVAEYIRPAVNIRINFNNGAVAVAEQPITAFINSQMGVASLVDMTVNRWTTAAKELTERAMAAVAQANGIRTLDGLRAIDERQIITWIANNGAAVNPAYNFIAKRAGRLITSTMSANKNSIFA